MKKNQNIMFSIMLDPYIPSSFHKLSHLLRPLPLLECGVLHERFLKHV